MYLSIGPSGGSGVASEPAPAELAPLHRACGFFDVSRR
jgi:hypothetical protein